MIEGDIEVIRAVAAISGLDADLYLTEPPPYLDSPPSYSTLPRISVETVELSHMEHRRHPPPPYDAGIGENCSSRSDSTSTTNRSPVHYQTGAESVRLNRANWNSPILSRARPGSVRREETTVVAGALPYSGSDTFV